MAGDLNKATDAGEMKAKGMYVISHAGVARFLAYSMHMSGVSNVSGEGDLQVSYIMLTLVHICLDAPSMMMGVRLMTVLLYAHGECYY